MRRGSSGVVWAHKFGVFFFFFCFFYYLMDFFVFLASFNFFISGFLLPSFFLNWTWGWTMLLMLLVEDCCTKERGGCNICYCDCWLLRRCGGAELLTNQATRKISSR
jgi:hypothetical protein